MMQDSWLHNYFFRITFLFVEYTFWKMVEIFFYLPITLCRIHNEIKTHISKRSMNKENIVLARPGVVRGRVGDQARRGKGGQLGRIHKRPLTQVIQWKDSLQALFSLS